MKLVRIKMDSRLSLILYILGIILVTSCVSGYVGKTVPRQNRIAVAAGGPHPGLWTGKHIEFNYTYAQTASQLEISGDLSFTKSSVYKSARELTLWMHFIDPEGKVIESITVFNSSSFRKGQTISKKKLSLPAGTNSFTFSYNGASGPREDPYVFHGSPF